MRVNSSAAEPCAVGIDPLTQLGNRQMLRERLSDTLAIPDQERGATRMLFVNVDRFKAVNHSLGYAMGDKLLRAVADRIRAVLCDRDFASHVGANEFAVILLGDDDQAASLATRLIDLLGRTFIIDGHMVNVGATIGIAPIMGTAMAHEDVMRNADLALRHAKQAGRGCYRFFACTMGEELQARHDLEVDLRRALALRELALVYQPQFNIASSKVTGFEALLRWRHPVRGQVSPAQFIPLAEEIGLIVPLGEWVIRHASREAARWPEPLTLAVNVSALQFRSPELATTIVSALAESGLQPRRLELEITESTLVAEHRAAVAILQQMRGMGVRVAMDDFGTGYSSLSYLRGFPFDKIKIDQSFVRGDPQDKTSEAIIHAVAALGKSLGIHTIAEGVETQDQMNRVILSGCTAVQGYLIGKPMSPEDIETFLGIRTRV